MILQSDFRVILAVMGGRTLSLLIVLIVLVDFGFGVLLHKRRGGLLTPPRRPPGTDLPQDQWFTQKLDHFDPTNTKTWQQRYFTNNTFYKPGGPVFLMIGGEGPANPVWLVEGTWISYAKKLGAYLLSLEHRFYGKSHPTEDTSVENLVYLTSEQALADLATFTTGMQENLSLKDNKWIAFGGSYPGTLAAWYRLKYPHLVHGSISTSAPLVAQVDFKEYLEVVRDALATIGEECNAAIKEATLQLNILLQHRVGWQSISQRFKLCSPLDGLNKQDVANLFAVLTDNINDVVQYNRDNRDFEGVKGTNITIETLCDIMLDEKLGPAVARYAAINSMILGIQEEECLDHTYKSMIEELSEPKWGDIAGRTWMYQTCTEFGFYQSSDSGKQPFGSEFPIQFFTQQCQDIFGQKFNLDLLNEGVKRTNILYGGRNLKVKRVIFLNGSIDPWHALGITASMNPDAPAIFINGTAHCANMYPESPNDPPQLIQAREDVFVHVQEWLQE